MTARGWDRSGLAPRRPCNLSVNLKVLKTKTVCLKYDTSKRFKRGLKSAKITLSSGRVRAGALRCGPRLYRGHFASARDAPERQGAAEVAGPRGRGAEPGEGRQRPRALWRLRGRSAAPGASRGWCPRAPDPAAPGPGLSAGRSGRRVECSPSGVSVFHLGEGAAQDRVRPPLPAAERGGAQAGDAASGARRRPGPRVGRARTRHAGGRVRSGRCGPRVCGPEVRVGQVVLVTVLSPRLRTRGPLHDRDRGERPGQMAA